MDAVRGGRAGVGGVVGGSLVGWWVVVMSGGRWELSGTVGSGLVGLQHLWGSQRSSERQRALGSTLEAARAPSNQARHATICIAQRGFAQSRVRVSHPSGFSQTPSLSFPHPHPLSFDFPRRSSHAPSCR
jgi:hypothetical protein